MNSFYFFYVFVYSLHHSVVADQFPLPRPERLLHVNNDALVWGCALEHLDRLQVGEDDFLGNMSQERLYVSAARRRRWSGNVASLTQVFQVLFMSLIRLPR